MSVEGNVNSVGDFIRSVFPSCVNRDGDIFKALLASGDGGGSVERIFAALEEERKTWFHYSVYTMIGEQLTKTFGHLSVWRRHLEDSDDVYRNMNWLLFARCGDSIWGTNWNLIHIFREFFNNKRIYIVNNTDDIHSNILRDADFEDKESSWDITNCGMERSSDRFEGTASIKFKDGGTCAQTVKVAGGSVYFLHFL